MIAPGTAQGRVVGPAWTGLAGWVHASLDDGARQRVIFISGPIAAGKSALASAVAQQLRGQGRSVAVVALDTVAEMALPSLDDWAWAHAVHGRLVGAWLGTPVQFVIVDGTAIPEEVDQVVRHIPADVPILRVLLTAEYTRALRRAQADPARGVSRDPGFLLAMYDRHHAALPDLAYDLSLDSESGPPSQLAGLVLAALGTPGSRQGAS